MQLNNASEFPIVFTILSVFLPLSLYAKSKEMAVEKANDQNFPQIIQDQDRVVVKYFADWCGSCKLFAPKYRRLSEDDRFSGIQFLEVNAEENEKARKMAGVDNLPYFAVFKSGELVAGSATSKEESVVELLNQLS